MRVSNINKVVPDILAPSVGQLGPQHVCAYVCLHVCTHAAVCSQKSKDAGPLLHHPPLYPFKIEELTEPGACRFSARQDEQPFHWSSSLCHHSHTHTLHWGFKWAQPCSIFACWGSPPLCARAVIPTCHPQL